MKLCLEWIPLICLRSLRGNDRPLSVIPAKAGIQKGHGLDSRLKSAGMTVTSDHRRKGFTIIEMVVVCSIIGCLTLVSIHGMQEMIPGVRVNRAVREITALLEWTRWQAVRKGSVFKVAFDSAAERVTIYREEINDDGEVDEVEVKRFDLNAKYHGIVFGSADGVKRTSGCRIVDPSGIHFIGQAVKFHPTGTADRCGSLYLIPARDLATQREDRMRAISVLLATARVALWKFNPLMESECNDDGVWLSF